MEIGYDNEALQDIFYWKKSGNTAVQKRITKLLEAIEQDPYTGIGKPEPLKYDLYGKWSRRII
jgi:toxin YoeB